MNAGLVEVEGRLRVIANAVRVEGPPPELASSSAPVAGIVLDPRPDLATAAECWTAAGGARCSALTTNVAMHVLETWAGIVGIDFFGIEAETTLRSFRRRLP